LQIHQQAAEIKQAATAFQIDQKIYVTVIVRIATRNRAEYTDIGSPVPLGDKPDLISFACYLFDSHFKII